MINSSTVIPEADRSGCRAFFGLCSGSYFRISHWLVSGFDRGGDVELTAPFQIAITQGILAVGASPCRRQHEACLLLVTLLADALVVAAVTCICSAYWQQLYPWYFAVMITFVGNFLYELPHPFTSLTALAYRSPSIVLRLRRSSLVATERSECLDVLSSALGSRHRSVEPKSKRSRYATFGFSRSGLDGRRT